MINTIHIRRLKTEEKEKINAAALDAESILFFAALAILHQADMKNRMNSSLYSNHPEAKYPARQWIESFCPLNSSDVLCLLFCLYPFTAMIIPRQAGWPLAPWCWESAAFPAGTLLPVLTKILQKYKTIL